MNKKPSQSFQAEVINPGVRKFLHQCALCGRVGLKLEFHEDDQDENNDLKTISREQERELAMRRDAVRYLRHVYEPLSLDAFGRCEVCVRVSKIHERAA